MSKAILQVHHRVNSYDAWRPFFDEHRRVREQHGATGHRIYRVAGEPNDLVVVNEFESEAGARAFAQDPSLAEIMGSAGVVGAPEVLFLDESEVLSYR